MKCPNGCDGSLVEREDIVKVVDNKEIPVARYHCNDCDWTAVWTKGRKLEVVFEGVNARENPFRVVGYHYEFVDGGGVGFAPDDDEGAEFQQACWGNTRE